MKFRDLAIALALLAGTSPARADDVTSGVSPRVRWNVEGETCPSPAALDTWLSASWSTTGSPADAMPRLHVRMSDGSETRAIITVDAGPEPRERTLREPSGDCVALARATVIVVAMLLDTEMVSTEITMPAPIVAPIASLPPPAAVPLDVAPPVDPSSVRVMLGISALASIDLLPGIAGGLGARIAVEPVSGLAVYVSGSLWPPSSDVDEGRGASIDAWLAGVGGCGMGSALEWLRLGGCADVQVGSMRGRGVGLVRTLDPERLLALVGVRGALELAPIAALVIRIEPGLAIPVARPVFVYERADGSPHVVHRPADVAAFLEVTLGFVIDSS